MIGLGYAVYCACWSYPQKLARHLQLRLQYARLKVDHGWVSKKPGKRNPSCPFLLFVYRSYNTPLFFPLSKSKLLLRSRTFTFTNDTHQQARNRCQTKVLGWACSVWALDERSWLSRSKRVITVLLLLPSKWINCYYHRFISEVVIGRWIVKLTCEIGLSWWREIEGAALFHRC